MCSLRQLVLALLFAGCATTTDATDSLRPAVRAYHDFLRWGKFESATRFLPKEKQALFLERYLATEDDLHIDHIEIRALSINPKNDDTPGADVTIVAQAYLLPSTILEKIIITERWEHHHGGWQLLKSSRELAPAPSILHHRANP